MIMNITRRMALKAPLFAGAAVAIPAAAVAASPEPIRAATYEDLTRYYAFLWVEMRTLSQEMCVEMHDSMTAHRNGDVTAVAEHLTAPPSTRANIVLQSVGADCETLVSTPLLPEVKSGQSAVERARYHYAEFAKAMNEATANSSGWLVMAGNRWPRGKIHSGAWVDVKTIHYEADNDPRCRGLVERHQDFEGIYA